MINKTFYFPIEIQSRELPSRLAIARHLVEKGALVVILDQHTLLADIEKLPPGVILHKDTADCNAGVAFRASKKFGWVNSALDEEGLVYFSESAYEKSRLGADSFKYLDLIFAWGEKQAKVIKSSSKFVPHRHKLVVSGHPKFDVHRDVIALKGGYILVNTRFGSVNSGLGLDENGYIQRMMLVDEVKDKQDELFRRGYFQFMNTLFDCFVELIEKLARSHPDQRIRVRAHPAESDKIYKDLASRYPNVEVSHDTSLEADLSGARVVIHNGCTTGIEGLAMGVPVLIYEPVPTPVGDLALPNEFGHVAKDFASLEQAMCDCLEGKYDWARARSGAGDFIKNFSTGSASAEIGKALLEVGFDSPTKFFDTWKPKGHSFLKRLCLALPSLIVAGPLKIKIDKLRYVDRKNPDRSAVWVKESLESNSASNYNQSKITVSVTKLGTKAFLIRKEVL